MGSGGLTKVRIATLLCVCIASVTGVTVAQGSDTITYRYDERGRLIQVQHAGSTSARSDYHYDRADNRTSVVVSGAGSVPPSNVAVANFSFEEPAIGAGFQYNPSAAGATFAGLSGVAGNGSAWGFAAAPAGTQVAFLQSTPDGVGSISLSVTGLTPGQSYVARLQVARRPVNGVNTVTVRFDNGPSLGTFTPPSTSFTQVTSQPFQATSSPGTISFSATALPGDSSVGIDQVTIVPVP